MFMERQTQTSKDVNSPQIDIQINTVPIEITARFFIDINNISLQVICKAAKKLGFS